MVAKAKNKKAAVRKNFRPHPRATNVRARKLQPAHGGDLKKGDAKEPEHSKINGTPGGNHFHAARQHDAPAIVKAEAAPAPPERERTSYDGDTAIKLYLREIGQ